jgi:hypothetical protein
MGEEEAGKRVNGWIMAWAYPCSPRHGADGLAQASKQAVSLPLFFLASSVPRSRPCFLIMGVSPQLQSPKKHRHLTVVFWN